MLLLLLLSLLSPLMASEVTSFRTDLMIPIPAVCNITNSAPPVPHGAIRPNRAAMKSGISYDVEPSEHPAFDKDPELAFNHCLQSCSKGSSFSDADTDTSSDPSEGDKCMAVYFAYYWPDKNPWNPYKALPTVRCVHFDRSLQASDFEVLPQAFQAKGFYNITRAANVDCEKVIGYATYTFKGAGSIRFTPSATVIVLGVVGAIALL